MGKRACIMAPALQYDNPSVQVLAHALDTFGSKTKADEWLNRPNQVFSGRSPIQILTEDPGIVEEELVRIDHGMFV